MERKSEQPESKAEAEAGVEAEAGAEAEAKAKDKREKKEKLKPVRIPIKTLQASERAMNFEEVIVGYSREEAMAEASRCILCPKPACVKSCPIGQDVPGYLKAISEGDFQTALEIIVRDNPLPRVCGRVCPHPCEDVCVIKKRGEPVAIPWLKRAAVESAEKGYHFQPAPPTGKRMAVVGSGPAGLACAWRLGLLGHQVNIFEAKSQLGGTLRYGIPSYRLPRAALDCDIERILALGIKVHPNCALGRDFTLQDLQAQGYTASFLGTGALKPKRMGIEGEELEGVMHVLDFMHAICTGNPPDVRGKKVAVIGGGFAAMDGVRSAKRLGADAFIVYRRDRDQMPASKHEVDHAEEEGIPIHVLTNPVKLIGENGKLKAMVCQKQRLGEPDASGRPRPVPIQGSEFEMETDIMIQAISQQPELSWMSGAELKLSRWMTLEVDPETQATNLPAIFAGGDVVTGPLDIINAIAAGIRAANSMHAYSLSTGQVNG